MDKSLNDPTPLVEVSRPFEDFGLDKALIKNIRSYGFTKTCIVQSRGIPAMLQKRDVILQSISSSGKTLASIISILQLINRASPDLQTLILAPTREIAFNIHRSILTLSADLGIRAEVCSGGVSFIEQRKRFQEEKFQVVVGTPGRIEDLIKRGFLKTDTVKVLVLDEFDEMLGRGFEEQVKSIIVKLPLNIQIMITTCTMPQEMRNLANYFMKEAIELVIKNRASFIEEIRQWYVRIPKEEWKLDTLDMIFTKIRVSQSIIYCNSSDQVDQITERSKKWRYRVSNILDDLEKSNKTSMFKFFKNHYSSEILITNDRTLIDIGSDPQIYLINYDLPLNCEEYITMVENIKPCNRDSQLLTLATPNEEKVLKEIEKSSQHNIREMILDAWNFRG